MHPSFLPSDALFQLERRIARRADELAGEFGTRPGSALEHWHRAEDEVWNLPHDLRQQLDTGWVAGEVFADEFSEETSRLEAAPEVLAQ